jgi:glycosyltransferase involved in cell wall biosynthesis
MSKKMKLITFAVPCYNSQAYMRKCINSLLSGGEDVEIIIINDGSKDDTINIARQYESEYQTIVRVVDKPNGGHGSGVNKGLQLATGLYYKVVDSDDWLDTTALKKLLLKIKEHLNCGTLPDLYITNFIYDKPSKNARHISTYGNKLPKDKIVGWDKMKRFHFSHMMLMHALLYKRENLLASGTVLPEHTFYVDNIFAYQPLPYMNTICYLDINLYHYFIGRADQSVNKNNMVARYEQQILVMRCMVDAYSWEEIKRMPNGLKNYMWHSLQVIMITTIFFTCASDYSYAREQALCKLWNFIKEHDAVLYKKLRKHSYTTLVNNLNWKFRNNVMSAGYKLLCKKIKLG